MTECTPLEGRLTFEQIRQLYWSLAEKVLDRAESEPADSSSSTTLTHLALVPQLVADE